EDHEIWSSLGGLLELLQTRLLDLPDLLGNELFARHVALQLCERIGRDGLALGRAQVFQALRCLLEFGIEAADAEPRQGRLDTVEYAGVLANEDLAFGVGTLGILLDEGRDRTHLAVVPLAAQPTEKRALQALGIEAAGLGAPVLARYRHARGMNDMGLDTARSQPAGEPEAVPAGLEGDRNPIDLVPSLLRLCSPSLEQF